MEKINKEKIYNALTELRWYDVASRSRRANSPYINIESIEEKPKAKDRFISVLKRDIYPLLSIEDHEIFENFEKNSAYDSGQLEKIKTIIIGLLKK